MRNKNLSFGGPVVVIFSYSTESSLFFSLRKMTRQPTHKTNINKAQGPDTKHDTQHNNKITHNLSLEAAF